LEIAKRRLVFTLVALDLPVESRAHVSSGIAFEFKADSPDPSAPRVLTGHTNGVITVNIAEADDSEREKRRHQLGEPYRTLLGHLRHESGHYYWPQLIERTPALDDFRLLFGDERGDYGGALAKYYQSGPPDGWPNQFVTAYASSHPWEDWAETWAHYLHMVDALETAAESGVQLKPPRPVDPALPNLVGIDRPAQLPFNRLIASWFPLTYVLNNLNRGLGLADGYPFVLSTPAIQKLEFVHRVITMRAASA
jgi:hypothetical protein